MRPRFPCCSVSLFSCIREFVQGLPEAFNGVWNRSSGRQQSGDLGLSDESRVEPDDYGG